MRRLASCMTLTGPTITCAPQRESLAAARLGLLTERNSDDEEKDVGAIGAIIATINASEDDEKFMLARFVKGFWFRLICMIGIAANTIYIGAAADHAVKRNYRRISGLQPAEAWVIPEIVFALWFSFELCLRITAFGRIFLSVRNGSGMYLIWARLLIPFSNSHSQNLQTCLSSTSSASSG